MTTSTGNIANVSRVRHRTRKPSQDQNEPGILRMAYVVVGTRGGEGAAFAVRRKARARLDAIRMNPPPIRMKLRMWNGPKCGLACQPNSISRRCPASCDSQLTSGYLLWSQPDRTIDAEGEPVHLGKKRDQESAEGAERPPIPLRTRLEEAECEEDEYRSSSGWRGPTGHRPESPLSWLSSFMGRLRSLSAPCRVHRVRRA